MCVEFCAISTSSSHTLSFQNVGEQLSYPNIIDFHFNRFGSVNTKLISQFLLLWMRLLSIFSHVVFWRNLYLELFLISWKYSNFLCLRLLIISVVLFSNIVKFRVFSTQKLSKLFYNGTFWKSERISGLSNLQTKSLTHKVWLRTHSNGAS